MLFCLICLAAGGAKAVASAPHETKNETKNGRPPQYDAVMNAIRPLEYSALYVMEDENVHLSIDFEKNLWTVHNVRRYAKDGSLVLHGGRYGLCAELAAAAYGKIRPVLGAGCEIKFVGAMEPGFFDTPGSNHVLLAIACSENKRTYLLDPSYHLYGPASDFSRYVLFDPKSDLDLIKKKAPNLSFSTGSYMPLAIRQDHLLVLSAEPCGNRFDPDHFMLTVSAKPRYRHSMFYLITLEKNGPMMKWLTNEDRLDELLSQQEIRQIKTRFLLWMTKLSG